MRAILAGGLIAAALGCGSNKISNDDDGSGGTDACVGLECNVVDCASMGMPVTSLVGKVYAPNGTLPLYGADVYIPRDQPGPFNEGAECARCTTDLPGSPIVATKTNEAGEFRLDNIPVAAEVPLVIQLGKWRRQVTLTTVAQCSDNALPATQTRLPKDRSEGDIPRIAITTGDADALECLIRKLGIADSEIGKDGGPERIHLYKGDGVGSSAGGPLPSATTLWNSLDKLKAYDISIFSCEGSQMANGNGGVDKTQPMLDNVKAYADFGGRVFLSHWHNVWISGNYTTGTAPTQPAWAGVGMFNENANPQPDTTTATIDEMLNPKGMSFATWMQNVGGSTMRGRIPVTQYRKQISSIDDTKAERWVYLTNPQGGPSVQNFQFTTPLEASTDQRCGKVVMSDMHVSGSPDTGKAYPNSCPGGAGDLALSPQEKALAFMFFDIATCVGGIF